MRYKLYRKLTTKLQKQLPQASKPQVENLALLTQALVFSPNCHLANLALNYPVPGRRESLVNRASRLLDNHLLKREVHYFPLNKRLLSRWPDREINLVMDRTDIGQAKSILLLGLAFRHRVIPLTWRVLPFGGTGELLQETLLREITPYLPNNKRVTFLGDVEFRAVRVQKYCQQQGWGWQLGVKSDTKYHLGDGEWHSLKDIKVKKGERVYLHEITLTKKHAWSPVHLLADWTYETDYPRYIICHQPTNRYNWRRGRKRFWVEPTFRDWKSYGFDLESSHITDDQRLDHLLLGMSVATLWLLHLGFWVEATNRSLWLTAKHRRDYSLFRLGRDYALRAQIMAWPLPVCFQR